MKRALRRSYFVMVYYASWGVFFIVGVALNLVCLPLLLLPRRAERGPTTRLVIRSLFDGWLKWMHFTRVVAVVWRGFDGVPLPAGVVYIANHPTLVDAPFLLARLPDSICIFKPTLMRNPSIGPAALMAGYPSGEVGVDLIRDTAERVANGRSLLIFPEGTRTEPGTILGSCKPGFALIASRARAPVQLIVVRASPDLATRGRPWWPAPVVLPGRVEFTLDQCWRFDATRSASELTAQVERRLREVLQPTPV
jgi:1-acyl-sn-glycerol-3-phosphate acyltransferase